MDVTSDFLRHISNLNLSNSQIAVTFGILLFTIASVGELFSKKKNGFAKFGNSRLKSWLTWQPIARMNLDQETREGYYKMNKEQGKAFIVPMVGRDVYVLPPKYLDVLKTAEGMRLSLAESFNTLMNLEATMGMGRDGCHDQIEIDVVGHGLNPNLTKLVPEIVEQTEFAFDQELGHLPEWKEFNVATFTTNLVNWVVNRMLVGAELSKNGDYIRAVEDYTITFLMNGGFGWHFRPPKFLEKQVFYLCAGNLRKNLRRCVEFLEPVIEARKKQLPNLVHSKDKPIDMIQWLLEMPNLSEYDAQAAKQAHRVVRLTFASTAVSKLLMINLVHKILERPQDIPILREEIERCVREHGGWTEKALANMNFTDSYIREMMRLAPPSALTGQRTVLGEPYHFDDGLVLPSNARMTFPTLAIHKDGDNYKNPESFDPWRFAGRKTAGGVEAGLSASQIDKKFLSRPTDQADLYPPGVELRYSMDTQEPTAEKDERRSGAIPEYEYTGVYQE
ncbi:MAG: hypothetical protein Q9157_002095 [Trypethelium eluteriae]